MSKIIDMLLDITNQGYSVEDLKKSVVQTLIPFFDHPAKATLYWTSAELLSVFEFIIKYHYDHDFSDGISETLSLYKAAFKYNEDLAYSILCSTIFDFSQKENMMWTVRKNVENINNGDYYEKIMSHMKHIGDILEIGTKHLIYELWALIQLTEGVIPDYGNICILDFGVITQNILNKQKFNSILTTSPLSIRLSDWRNIAYHHTYRIVDEAHISCTYGKKKLSFILNTEDLTQYTHKIVRSSNILNIARCIFLFDYIDELSKYKCSYKNEQEIRFRDSILENNLRISMLSQSFLLESIIDENDMVIASIVDLMNDGSLSMEKEKDRYIHSSQFLYEIWCAFKKDQVQVKYVSRQGVIKLISTVDGEVCRKIQSEKEELQYMAQHVNFKFQL